MDGANRLTKAGCLQGVSKQTLDALWQMGKTDKLKSGTILFHARSMPEWNESWHQSSGSWRGISVCQRMEGSRLISV